MIGTQGSIYSIATAYQHPGSLSKARIHSTWPAFAQSWYSSSNPGPLSYHVEYRFVNFMRQDWLSGVWATYKKRLLSFGEEWSNLKNKVIYVEGPLCSFVSKSVVRGTWKILSCRGSWHWSIDSHLYLTTEVASFSLGIVVALIHGFYRSHLFQSYESSNEAVLEKFHVSL